jgi:hypothetical protein
MAEAGYTALSPMLEPAGLARVNALPLNELAPAQLANGHVQPVPVLASLAGSPPTPEDEARARQGTYAKVLAGYVRDRQLELGW